ncbi:MAG: fatty acid desaturase [Bacteroidota bacterium]
MGIIIAITIILVWLGHLVYTLIYVAPDPASPFTYLHIAVQGYLFTGLFITGHDAIHRSISGKRWVNDLFGWLASALFAGLSYKKLTKNHWLHHRFPGMPEDPDFYVKSRNFWRWWLTFMYRYVTVFQIIIMAAAFNILLIWFSETSLLVFWIIPAFMGTFQMFYFGVFQPHKLPHRNWMKPYNSRTQRKNHFWAMLSCYFFGYHYEHHDSPTTPWWKLYQTKAAT